jgi:hypothetical protein
MPFLESDVLDKILGNSTPLPLFSKTVHWTKELASVD